MITCSSISPVLALLHGTNLDIPTFLRGVLLDSGAAEELLEGVTKISDILYQHSPEVMHSWALDIVTRSLQSELVSLTHPRHGFHHNISQATSRSLEGSFMEESAGKVQKLAPHLRGLLQKLLDANPASRHARAYDKNQGHTAMGKRETKKGLLGGVADSGDHGNVTLAGEDIEMEAVSRVDDMDCGVLQERVARKSTAASRNVALVVIVSCSKNRAVVLQLISPGIEVSCLHVYISPKHKRRVQLFSKRP